LMRKYGVHGVGTRSEVTMQAVRQKESLK